MNRPFFPSSPEHTSRPWRVEAPLIAAALALGSVACGSGAATFASVTRWPERPRRADGVAIDPAGAQPIAHARARTEEGVVALREPLGLDAARAVVRGFFEAVAREDFDSLSRLTLPTAVVADTRGRGADRVHNLGFLWRQRFTRFDHSVLDPDAIVRDGGIETYAFEHTDGLPRDLRAAGPGEALGPDDVVLRVPVLGQSSRPERILGDALTFWLRRIDDRFVIVRVAEDVPL